MYIPTSINDALKSLVSNYMFLIEEDFPITKRGKNDVFLLSNDIVMHKYVQLYNALYDVLGVPMEGRSTNLGDTSFDSVTKQASWFNAPTIGLKNNELGLMIGVDSGENHKSCFVPLKFYDSGEPENGITPSKYYYFSFDGKTKTIANLVPMPSPYGDGNEIRYYVMPNKPGQQRGFYLPFKCDKEIGDEAITAAWESGNFHVICKPFNSSFVNLSNCFGLSFQDGTFPVGGVLILLKKGKLNVTNWNNSKISNAKWEVEATTHPNLVLGLYQSKQLIGTTTLDDVGMFSTGSSSEPYNLVNLRIEMGESPVNSDGSDKVLVDYCLLYVQSPNMQRSKNGQSVPRYDFQPVHKATSNPQKLTLVFPKLNQLYPDFIKGANSLILEATMSKMKPIAQPSVVQAAKVQEPVATEIDDETDWDNEDTFENNEIPF